MNETNSPWLSYGIYEEYLNHARMPDDDLSNDDFVIQCLNRTVYNGSGLKCVRLIHDINFAIIFIDLKKSEVISRKTNFNWERK